MCGLMVSASAAGKNISLSYGISLAGLPIAKAGVSMVFDDGTYRISGAARPRGLAKLVRRVDGAASTQGNLTGGMPSPTSFSYSTRGKSNREVNMSLSAGRITNVRVTPRKTPRADRIPLQEKHLMGVIDPLSAMFMPADRKHQVCDRKIPIFDGQYRYNVVLSPAGRQVYAAKGFRGAAYVCRLSYEPIAGHRPQKRSVKYMAANKNMQIWFASVGDGSYYLPVYAAVATYVGRITFAIRSVEVQ